MIKELSIRIKVLFLLFFCGIAIMAAVGAFSYYSRKNLIYDKQLDFLRVIRDTKKDRFDELFAQDNLKLLRFIQNASNKEDMIKILEAYKKVKSEFKFTKEQQLEHKKNLTEYYREFFLKKLNASTLADARAEDYMPIDDVTVALQYQYISNNPNPVGSKDILSTVEGSLTYNAAHASMHAGFRDFIKRYDFYDLFVIDPETGVIVYTVFKEVDFATSLLEGPYSKSGLGAVFNRAVQSSNPEETFFIDFAPYDPSYHAPAAFLATSVFKGGKKIAVVAVQFSTQRLNNLMTFDKQWKRYGLENTGEVYLVANDYKMRSVSRFFEENKTEYLRVLNDLNVDSSIIDSMNIYNTTITLQSVRTDAVKKALEGATGSIVQKSYLGKNVISMYMPLEVYGLPWALIVEQEYDEVFAPLISFMRIFSLLGLAILFFLLSIAYFGMGFWVSSLNVLIDRFTHLSKDEQIDLTVEIPVTSGDEAGLLEFSVNKTFERFKQLMNSVRQVYNLLIESLKKYGELLKVFVGGKSDLEKQSNDLLEASGNLQQQISKLIGTCKRIEVMDTELIGLTDSMLLDLKEITDYEKNVQGFADEFSTKNNELLRILTREYSVLQAAVRPASQFVHDVEASKKIFEQMIKQISSLKEVSKKLFSSKGRLEQESAEDKNVQNFMNLLSEVAQTAEESKKINSDFSFIAQEYNKQMVSSIDIIGKITDYSQLMDQKIGKFNSSCVLFFQNNDQVKNAAKGIKTNLDVMQKLDLQVNGEVHDLQEALSVCSTAMKNFVTLFKATIQPLEQMNNEVDEIKNATIQLGKIVEQYVDQKK